MTSRTFYVRNLDGIYKALYALGTGFIRIGNRKRQLMTDTTLKVRRRGVDAVLTLLILAFVQTGYIPQAACALPKPGTQENPAKTPLGAGPPSNLVVNDPVFYADRSTGTFAVFESADDLNRPIKFGTFQEYCGRRRINSLHEIRAEGRFYIFTNPNDPHFLSVSERLPEGGFGRLLRYRGTGGRGKSVDLEFVYEDRQGRVTLLDYQGGRFYQTDFSGLNETAQLFPVAKEVVKAFELNSTVSSYFRFLIPRNGDFFLDRFQADSIDSLVMPLNEQKAWYARLLRGPPTGGQIS